MTNANPPRSALTPEEVRGVSPALAEHTQKTIAGDLWKCPELSPRDRGIITVAALIARNQTIGMLHYFNLALDSGVTPGELSEIITHLAFYSGWPNALAASPLQGRFSCSAVSRLISSPNHRPSACRSMKPPKQNAPPLWSRISRQLRRVLCNTPLTYCFVIYGYARL
jgi:alkylhydroperoxidase/carboxymuconolactone decarboxylase family protein YurZ